ncbi:MAG: right-handed parallel beta-helix repeat-containing protein [Verrucomicrobiota bacterium]
MPRFNFLLSLFVGCLLFFGGVFRSDALEIFVAQDGQRDAPGTIDKPITFLGAIDRASLVLKESGVPDGGLTISLRGGIYPLTEPVILGREFKGTLGSLIRLQAYSGESVVFDGRVDVQSPDRFSPVTDANERAFLAASAVDDVRVVTVRDPALIGALSNKVMLQLSQGDVGYAPAVFPNDGYAKLDTVPVREEVSPPAIPRDALARGVRAGHKPYLESGKPKGWLGSLSEPRGAHARISEGADQMSGTWEQWAAEIDRDNTRNEMVGFYEAVWKLSKMPVYAADANASTLHLTRAFSYGFGWLNKNRGGQPFRIYGLLAELDQPGEWYFDPKTKRLFIYPVEAITADSKIGLPVASGFLDLKETEHVQVVGLDVRNVGSGTIIRIDGGNDNLIANCSVSQSNATGIRIRGRRNGVRGCDFFDLDSHIILCGREFDHANNYRNMDSTIHAGSGNFVENCHIYQKDFRHAKINISLSGMGQVFRNNLIHNSIGQAMTVRGNGHLIELNELFNIGFEEGDGGAIYAGADLTGYGVVYRHNFFHHLIRTPGKHGRAGIHLDDLQAGATCIGNVFFKSCTGGIVSNGGAGNTVVGNVFLEGDRGAFNRGNWGERVYQQYLDIESNPDSKHAGNKEDYVGRAVRLVGEEAWGRSPWLEKYPLFNRVMSEAGRYGRLWPIYCTYKNNIYHGNRHNRTELAAYSDELRSKTVMENDVLVSQDAFVDYDNFDLTFAQEIAGVEPIPFDRIGLYLDEYRSEMPLKQHYRMAIKTFYEGDDSYSKNRPEKPFDSAAAIGDGS